MIKTEKGNTVMKCFAPIEMEADLGVVVRAVYRVMTDDLHKTDEEAKTKIRETVEEALNYQDKTKEGKESSGETMQKAWESFEKALKEMFGEPGNPEK